MFYNLSFIRFYLYVPPTIFCYACSAILPPLSGCSHSYHQTPCVRVAKNPLKPVLKGPDPSNLESLFRSRYSNQAAHRAPTLVSPAFTNKPHCCTFSHQGLSKGPSALPMASSAGNPPALGYPDLPDTQLAPQTEPDDPSQVPWKAHLTETFHLEVDATINGIIVCVSSWTVKILPSADHKGGEHFSHPLQ